MQHAIPTPTAQPSRASRKPQPKENPSNILERQYLTLKQITAQLEVPRTRGLKWIAAQILIPTVNILNALEAAHKNRQQRKKEDQALLEWANFINSESGKPVTAYDIGQHHAQIGDDNCPYNPNIDPFQYREYWRGHFDITQEGGAS